MEQNLDYHLGLGCLFWSSLSILTPNVTLKDGRPLISGLCLGGGGEGEGGVVKKQLHAQSR